MTAKSTSRQESQAGKLARDWFESLGFNKDVAQRVLTHPGFMPGYKELCQKLAADGSALATGLVPAGWTVVEDVAASQLDVASLRSRAVLRTGESYVGGDEMRRRAVTNEANWGLSDGQRILAKQGELSREFDGKVIPLPGTVLRGPGGGLCVGCLYRGGGGRLRLDFGWLDDVWSGLGRFAVCE